MLQIEHKHIARSRLAVNFCAITVALVGIVSLPAATTGFSLWNTPLRSGTCLVYIALGIGLLLLNRRPVKQNTRRIVTILSAFSFVVGCLGLCEYFFGSYLYAWPPLLDFIKAVTHPNSVAPTPLSAAALSSLAAIGVLLGTWPTLKTRRAAQYLGVFIAALSMVPVLGYTFHLNVFIGGANDAAISLTAAVAYYLLGAALVFLHPVDGPVAVVLRSSIGGSMARRLFPVLFVVPLLGFVATSQHSGHDLSLVFLLLLINFGLPVLIWALATTLEEAEEEKKRAFQHIEALNHELNSQVMELVHAKDQATAAVKTRSQFVANVSHELRTPLSGIIGVAELLQDTRLDQNQKELLGIVQDSSRALLNIINDILDFSKMEAHKMQLERIDFELVKTVDSVTRSLRNKATDKKLQLTTHVASDVPRTVKGDNARLRQVLSNLIDNAIKFTEQGKVTVDVTVNDAYEDKVVLRFAVTDTGIGITPETVDKLFQPFVQADGSFTRKYGGTGLGLSICKTLVELMGGQMGVLSASEQGSTFWFEIPFQKAAANLAQHPAHPLASPVRREAVVLIAEDNEVNAKISVMQLRKLGYETEVVTSGREAVEKARQTHYALVLMDVQMPDKDGFEATREIRDSEKNTGYHVPIVAMTAHAMQGDRERCLNAGMDDHLTKPVNLDALRDITERWILEDPTLPSGAQVIPFRQRSG